MSSLSSNLGQRLLESFLETSKGVIEDLLRELDTFNRRKERKKIRFFSIKNDKVEEIEFYDDHFFLRSSMEYSNPQLTVEEVQGIIAAKLIEVCGNYFACYRTKEVAKWDVKEMCEMLRKPYTGKIVSFLLNTDDVEPDRYSMNPLKESIIKSGQSSFPSASVKIDELEIDQKFMQKYQGSLISQREAELIERYLHTGNNSYMDMADAVKYNQLEHLSEFFGINLALPSLRMPLSVLKKETPEGLLHYIIGESHKDYLSIEELYRCMGRSLKKRTTLLTVPHSKKGYGSKRSARGKLYFDGTKLQRVRITYRTTPLYPNAIDPDDVSIAKGEDRFIVEGDKLFNYNFKETPSSPQFILYSLGVFEDAVIWHGIGAFGASQLVKSYTSTHLTCAQNPIFTALKEKYGIQVKVPLQLNLIPKKIWVNPLHDNIDASIYCVENLEDLVKMGVTLESLSTKEYVRN
jgi:hypothetical protein